MLQIDITQEHAIMLEQYVTDHLNNAYNQLMDEEVPEGYNTYDIFCGCDVCNTRELLMSTFAYLRILGYVDIAIAPE